MSESGTLQLLLAYNARCIWYAGAARGSAYAGGDSHRFISVVNVPGVLQAQHIGQLSYFMIHSPVVLLLQAADVGCCSKGP